MKAIVISILLIFSLSLVQAEIKIVEEEKIYEHPMYEILTEQGLTLTSNYDFDRPHFFIDGELIHTQVSIAEGESITLPASAGVHELEVKALKDFEYIWMEWDVIKDDKPVVWEYFNHDQDGGRISFSLTGADMFHPKDLERSGESYNEKLEDYEVRFNEAYGLYCYPKIRTGNDLAFSCKTQAYPEKLELALTLGVMEVHTIELDTDSVLDTEQEEIEVEPEEQEVQDELVEIEVEPEDEVLEEENLIENIERADNIELVDTIPSQEGLRTPIVILIIIMFVAVMALLYVASHHRHESKQAGRFHPQKKKKEEKKDEETKLPRYAPDPSSKPRKR